MFLARSAFWLSLAFVVVAPATGTDAGSMARSAGEQLVQRGAGAVTASLAPDRCGSVECAMGRALIAGTTPAPAAAEPAAIETGHIVPHLVSPVPPPRPDWAQ